MSASLHLCSPDDLERLLPLVAAFHAGAGIERDDADRRHALAPLLEGSPHGVVYLIGPRRAPVGYIVLSFGYSVARGGIEAFIDEFYIRRAVRGRAMGQEALGKLMLALGDYGVMALSIGVPENNEKVRALYQRQGFAPRGGPAQMTRALKTRP